MLDALVSSGEAPARGPPLGRGGDVPAREESTMTAPKGASPTEAELDAAIQLLTAARLIVDAVVDGHGTDRHVRAAAIHLADEISRFSAKRRRRTISG
jgi:hypothetical protein